MTELLPIAHRFAAALEQVPATQVDQDPAVAVHVITSATRQFGWSLAVSHWRIGVEAEALGAEIDLDDARTAVRARTLGSADNAACVTTAAAVRHTLAVTRGVRGALGSGTGLAATLTGPRTLSALLHDGGGRLDVLYGPLIRAYIEAGADRLLIVEASHPRPESPPGGHSRTLRSLISTARYFRASTMMLDLSCTDLARYIEFDHVFGRDDAVLLPPEAIRGAPQDSPGTVADATIATTAGQIPADCPPELVARWTEHLRAPGQPVRTTVS
jgi:Uroporphyrinogen decarboxylase (URO-D)